MKKRSKFLFKFLYLMILIFCVLSLGMTFILHYSIDLSSSRVIHVANGRTVTSIAKELKQKGLLRSITLFKLYIRFNGLDSHIRSGYFHVPSRINTVTLVDILSTNTGAYYLEKITFPEGFSLRQIADRLEKYDLVDADQFFNYVSKEAKNDYKSEFDFLNFEAEFPTLEGYLFPDTYFFSKQDNTKSIVKTMLTQFEKVIYSNYKQSGYKGSLTFHELVTMASLIEKESRIVSEMSLISSVFHNRLSRRIRLRTDPTVVYALGLSYKKRVYYKDLEVDSPYNTYKNLGLPPTGIASPGLKAFKAACFPDSSPYLFFVAKKDGSHYFTKTYQEHLRVQRLKQ